MEDIKCVTIIVFKGKAQAKAFILENKVWQDCSIAERAHVRAHRMIIPFLWYMIRSNRNRNLITILHYSLPG
jgi:hypothetical protein